MKKVFFFLLLTVFHFCVSAQEITKQDYDRAAALQMRNLGRKIFNLNVNVNWYVDSTGFSYITQDKKEKRFNKFEFSTMKAAPLFDHERLAKSLSELHKKPAVAADLPVTDIRYINKIQLSVTTAGKNYTLNLTDYTLTPKEEQ
ncbi:MAG: hypothetical protein KA160_10330, partial [Lacibacter sp.]|nr:hypothetical protein [Lacibacter sp.]